MRGEPTETHERFVAIFGWLKSVALLRKVRHRGQARVGWMFSLQERYRFFHSGSDCCVSFRKAP